VPPDSAGQVTVTVHGAIEAEFVGGVCYTDDGDFTPYGTNASLTKDAGLLTGAFSSDDISGEYSCPALTPANVVRGSG